MSTNLYPKSHHVVIVGAGYAGLPCAVRLGHNLKKIRLSPPPKVTLCNNGYQQELTCDLNRTLRTGRPSIFQFKALLKRLDIEVIDGTVSEIAPQKKEILVRGERRRQIAYDTLIVAPGAKSKIPESIVGLKEMVEDSEKDASSRIFSFRNNMQVQALRLALQRSSWSPDLKPPNRKDFFVVILGAGATGIEVAGELAWLRGKNARARVVLIDEKTELLPDFSPIAQRVLKSELNRMKIETILGSPVIRCSENELFIKNGQVIPWDLCILCAGSRTSSTLLAPFGESSPSGLEVTGTLEIKKFRHHFAVGDAASVEFNRRPLQKQAQFAVQQGRFVADLLSERLAHGSIVGEKSEEVYLPQDLGYIVNLGPNSGVGRIGPNLGSKAARYLSPFVFGPVVEQLKKAARFRYLSNLKLKSYF